jgi:hypothetical protein
MNTPPLHFRQSASLAIWLLAFFSPSAYFLLLLLARGLPFSRNVPEALVVSLLCIIPLGALLVCESVVLSARLTIPWKIGGMVFTLVASLLQFGIIIAFLRAILITAIAYPQ